MATNNLDSFTPIIETFKTELSDIINNRIIPVIIEKDLEENVEFTPDVLIKLSEKIRIFMEIGNETALALIEEYQNFIAKKSELLALGNVNIKTGEIKDPKINNFDYEKYANIYRDQILLADKIWKNSPSKGISETQITKSGGNLSELHKIFEYNKDYLESYQKGIENLRKIKKIEFMDEILNSKEPKSMIELILYSTLYINDESSELQTLIKILKGVKSAFNLLYNFRLGGTIGNLGDRYESLKNYFARVGKEYSILKDNVYVGLSGLNIKDLPIQPDAKWICFYVHDIKKGEKLDERDMAFLMYLFNNEDIIDKSTINSSLTSVDIDGVITLLETRKSNCHKFLLILHKQIKNVMGKVNKQEEKKEIIGKESIDSKIILDSLSLLLIGKDKDIKKAVNIGNQILEKADFSNEEIDSIILELKKKADTIYKKN